MQPPQLELRRDADGAYVRAGASTPMRETERRQVLSFATEHGERLALRPEGASPELICLLAAQEAADVGASVGPSDVRFALSDHGVGTLTVRLPPKIDVCSMVVVSPVLEVTALAQRDGWAHLELYASSNGSKTIVSVDKERAASAWYWLHTMQMNPRWTCLTDVWVAKLEAAEPKDVDGRFAACVVPCVHPAEDVPGYLDPLWTKMLWATRVHAVRSIADLDRQTQRCEAALARVTARRESGVTMTEAEIESERRTEAALASQVLEFAQERTRRRHVCTAPTPLDPSVHKMLLCAAAEEMLHDQLGVREIDVHARVAGIRLMRVVGIGLGWKAHTTVVAETC